MFINSFIEGEGDRVNIVYSNVPSLKTRHESLNSVLSLIFPELKLLPI